MPKWPQIMSVMDAHGVDIAVGSAVAVRLGHDSVQISDCRDGVILAEARGADLRQFVVPGPGLVQEGGGFFGGGFGMEGALKGMAAASVLNSLTSSSRIESMVRVGARSWSLVLFCSELTPDQLRVLAPQVASSDLPSLSSASMPLPQQLAELGSLCEQGVLTAEEFSAAKRRLLEK